MRSFLHKKEVIIKDVIVIDEIMGSGKTSAAINFINSNKTEKFIFVSPFLSEMQRIKDACPDLNFQEPSDEIIKSKTVSFRFFLDSGNNIVTTHQLLLRQSRDIAAKVSDYTLIIDEALNGAVEAVDEYWPFEKAMLLENCFELREKGFLRWTQDPRYKGSLLELKEKSDQGRLKGFRTERSCGIFEVFPSEILLAFKNVYVLTYMFESQNFSYYLKSEGIDTRRIYIKEDSGNYFFSEDLPPEKHFNFNELITIHSGKISLENPKGKLNAIGDENFSLSKNWYKTRGDIKKLCNNTYNFLLNIVKAPSSKFMWTTFSDFENMFTPRLRKKTFVPCNSKATNDYADRTTLAYLVNLFVNPGLVAYYKSFGITVSHNGFALSEMIQWIWRSAIRCGEKIDLYIPSSRQRALLCQWLDSISENNRNEEFAFLEDPEFSEEWADRAA